MLSGNGRHRRPRQAPALLVAAGVTGSAIAIPLLGATGASAASGTTWDAVADCESGGSWSANSGNGYYGGLQMTQETWEQFGGLDYAPSADQASRSQQIAVAEKVLAGKGTSAWATCSLVAGLSQDSESADVDTGVLDDSASPSTDSGTTSGETGGNDTKSGDSAGSGEPDKSDSSTGGDATSAPDSDTSGDSQSSDSSSTGDATGTTDATGTAKSDDSDKSAQNGDASTGTDTGADSGADDGATSGRHRGGSADENATGSRTDDSSGRHASRDDSASREAADGSYIVRAGDSLWEIADSLGVNGGWRELYAANKASVGADPDLIVPGQSLELDSE
ncbi:transglycosylase family protein [Streptomyces sp. NPDC050704]|uniref:transglycosylase family protein n=1 Tax=Streptomyces sp. NPDC050704 TaxID=3157219 RepID=UPI00341606ED